MIEFSQKQAGTASLSRRKMTYGVGCNDAWYIVNTVVDEKALTCPYYRVWHNMLKRCYDKGYQKAQPTYSDCSVCEDWLLFSNFRKWMEAQDWQGKELDKDILAPGNKVYSPETCLFVSRDINALLNFRSNGRDLPQGVWFDRSAGKYRAEITKGKKKLYIGIYDSSEDAAIAYRKAKADHLRNVASELPAKVAQAIVRHAEILEAA